MRERLRLTAGAAASEGAHQQTRVANRARRGALAGLVLADVGFAFQQTAVIPPLPVIGRSFAVSSTTAAWVLTGWLLVAAIALPLSGRFADSYGTRRVLVWILVIYVAGSIGAAVAPSFAVLIACRCLQGVGGAIFPLTMALVRTALPRERLERNVGILTAAFGVGAAAGYGGSGLLLAISSWRIIFVAGAVIVATSAVLVKRLIPHVEPSGTRSLSLGSGALLGLSLVLGLLGLSRAASEGPSPLVLGGLLGFVLIGCAWWRLERKAVEPLLGLNQLRQPLIAGAAIVSFSSGFAAFGVYYAVPYMVESSRTAVGSSSVTAGSLLLAAALGLTVAGPITGRARSPAHLRVLLVGGLCLIGISCVSMSVWGYWSLPAAAVSLLFLGVGNGIAIGSSSAVIATESDAAEIARANTTNQVIRLLGSGVGSEVAALILRAAAGSAHGFVIAYALFGAVGAAAAAGTLRVVHRRRSRSAVLRVER